jgi:hypothetical protein
MVFLSTGPNVTVRRINHVAVGLASFYPPGHRFDI